MSIALVTGGTKNIGLAVARRLGHDGHTVIVNGRTSTAVDSAVSTLRDEGLASHGVVADVSDEHAVTAMMRAITDEHGHVGILVNNAGLRYHGQLADTPLADWNRVLGVVLTGAFLTMRAALPGMIDAGWGRIVSMAGLSAESGAPLRSPLVAAKGGVIALTRGAALEVAGSGITVNAVSPGFIDTDRSPTLGDASVAAAHYRSGRDVPVGHVGQPEDVAAMCSYLCSDDASYVTGQVMRVNGGARL